MQGLDLAFYKGRSRYHTKYDTVPYTAGGKRSLWSMMEVAKGSGIELLNGRDTGVNPAGVTDKDAPVYFDRKHNIAFTRPDCSRSIFSVQIDCVCFSGHQSTGIQYCYPHPWSNHTCRTDCLEPSYRCKASKIQRSTISPFQS